jgi:hypothetical protein
MNFKRVSLATSFLVSAAIVTGDAHVVQAHTATVRVDDGHTVVEHNYRNYRIIAPAPRRHSTCRRPALYAIPIRYIPVWPAYERRGYYKSNIFHHSGVHRTVVFVR